MTDRELSDLLDVAKALPDAANTAPGGLGQLIAGVEYATAGKPIRLGAKTLDERIALLQEAVEAQADAAGTGRSDVGV